MDSKDYKSIFTDYYNKYHNKIYNYIYRNVFNKESTEDITGNTFLKAFEFIKRKDRDIENFNSWIYKIATNEILKYYIYCSRKKKLFHNEVNIDEIIQDTEDKDKNSINKYLNFADLKEKMNKLSDKERIIIDLHYFENMEYSEMSKILNIREVTIRSKVFRILKKLGKFLNYEL